MSPEKYELIANLYDNIAVITAIEGNFEEEQKYYEEALKIRLKNLPPTHSHTGNSYRNISGVLSRQQRYEECLQYKQMCLEILLSSLTPNHVDLLAIYNELANLYLLMGRALDYHRIVIKAIDSSVQLLEKSISFLGVDHAISQRDIQALISSVNKHVPLPLESTAIFRLRHLHDHQI
ncbi:unnamed protein product [Rotaria magnacalcarata]|uniref:Kinesin light chain n=1 Tax=Rotaria magnacalcarata TaxID=392030 RepID=A0A816PXB7_9BILA|nr:unnamed protein product [Rotaria magnacalcarata]CAF2053475.1 unnamed protein product [Rotaria magnacalcarata]CAF3886402.1 unnamed protein product [Rotaria magnacalcarata]CAF3930157.1 unnamed protein product [Rotaria magnacalcarata]